MPMPLLTTKLFVPPARPDLVPRPGLIQRLNEGLTRKLTLVSAPAGYGKTTLLAEWIATLTPGPSPVEQGMGEGVGVCWLSLDENDNDPVRFITYLVAALQRIDPKTGEGTLGALQSPQPPPLEAVLTALVNKIAAIPTDFALVLDDYHVIKAPPIHSALNFLLEHLPAHIYLVIATREDPPLPLARLRGRGQLTELREADLRFTPDEAATFLNQVMGLNLTADEVAALAARTEGWIAGLQMAALSMHGHQDIPGFIRAFTGSHRYILDYLMEEVFQRQPAGIQDFLLQTSILDRFTAPLCDAVAERDDSRAVLLTLEQANLFTIPLDESRQWYRYRHLFADLLRHRLDVVSGAKQVALLHARASQWFEAAGFPAEAIQHALAGADWARAATLILGSSDTMLKRGEVTTLLNWLKALPDDLVRAHPQLCLTYSWALILAAQLDAAESYLRQAAEVAQDKTPLLGDIIAAQAFIARTRGDDRRTIELSQRALSLMPPDNLAGRSVVTVNLGIAHWNSGHLTEAAQALTEADRAAQQSGNIYARLMALGFLGLIQAAWGKLHRAAELFEQAIGAGEQLPPVALVHNELGTLLYEWNDLAAAADHLQRGIELGQRSGNVEVQSGGYCKLARLKQAQGNGAAAMDALQKAHQLAREHDVSPLMRARNAACHVQIALAQDDLNTAVRWAEQVTEDADASPFYPLLGLTSARLLLAQGEKAVAAQRLQACYETARRAGWQYGVVEVRTLQALAAPTPSAALAFLADALTLAQPEGYVRTFLDKGEPMTALLRQAAARGIAPEYVAKLLAAFGAEARVPPAPLHLRPPALPLLEPLSKRELDVLRLVAVGRSNREIAEALFVSVNTVKTHLMRLYAKLGVNSRTAAVTRARDLALL